MKNKLLFMILFSLLVILFPQPDNTSAADTFQTRVIDWPEKPWYITFSMPVDDAIPEGAITITDSKNNILDIDLRLRDRSELIVYPLESYEYGETYTLTVTPNVKSASGTPLNRPAILKFSLDETVKSDVENAIATLSLGNTDNISSDLNLPSEGLNNTKIEWTSNNEKVISNTGTFERPLGESDVTVTLTAKVSKGYFSKTKDFQITVKAQEDKKLEQAVAALTLGSIDNVTSDLFLPTTGLYDTIIVWTSDYNTIISNTGVVTRPYDSDTVVTLTAKVSKGNTSKTKKFKVTVEGIKRTTAERAINALDIGGIDNVTSDLYLPTMGIDYAAITWASSDEQVIRISGEAGVVTRPSPGQNDKAVTLTAVAYDHSTGATAERTFKVTVKAQEALTMPNSKIRDSKSNESSFTEVGDNLYFSGGNDPIQMEGDSIFFLHMLNTYNNKTQEATNIFVDGYSMNIYEYSISEEKVVETIKPEQCSNYRYTISNGGIYCVTLERIPPTPLNPSEKFVSSVKRYDLDSKLTETIVSGLSLSKNYYQTKQITIYKDELFYINEDNHISKVNLKNGSQTLINKSLSSDIQIVDDWIYFTEYPANSMIVWWDGEPMPGYISRMKTDGSSKQTVHSSTTIHSMEIVDEYVYFVSTLDSKIYRVRLDGTGLEIATSIHIPHSGYSIQNDSIYYLFGSLYYDVSIYKTRLGVPANATELINPEQYTKLIKLPESY